MKKEDLKEALNTILKEMDNSIYVEQHDHLVYLVGKLASVVEFINEGGIQD